MEDRVVSKPYQTDHIAYCAQAKDYRSLFGASRAGMVGSVDRRYNA